MLRAPAVVIVAALLLVTLGACTSEHRDSATYGSFSELQAAVEKADHSCTTLSPVLEHADARQMALCGDGTVLAVYAGPKMVASQLALARSLQKTLGAKDESWLCGPNWTISGTSDLGNLQSRLGGRLCTG